MCWPTAGIRPRGGFATWSRRAGGRSRHSRNRCANTLWERGATPAKLGFCRSGQCSCVTLAGLVAPVRIFPPGRVQSRRRRAHSRFPGAVCRQRWTVRLGEVEPVFGQTGRVVLDITARTAHDGALKWTRAPSTPRAARSIFATFPSTCALPSGGRWSLRRVLQRPGRQRKRSSAKSSCGPSRTSSSAPSSPPCCNARCAPPRLATRRAPSCATCPGGCGATAWRPSTFAPPGARRCRSRRRTTARNTPVGRSGGRDSTP